MRRLRGLFPSGVLLAWLAASGAAESPPAAPAGPPATPGSRLQGLPGPAGTGLLPDASRGAAKSCGEVGREIERFLGEEVEPARQRLAWQRAADRTGAGPILVPSTVWGLGYVPGGPVVLAVQPPGGWDPGPVGAAVLLGLDYLSEKARANPSGCEAFLEGRGEALRFFWESSRGADDAPAPPDLRDAVERRMSEIRSSATCRGQFRPPAAVPVPFRPPEGLP